MTSICIVTALPAEAKPLTAHFGMRAVPHPWLKLYDGGDCMLLQCGMGKLAAATAVGAMMQLNPTVKGILNVGIAGADLPLGSKVLAHAVRDQASDQLWYPHLPAKNKLSLATTVEVITVDKPATNYSTTSAFDMEAAGVLVAASKTLDLAFVQFLKVISDNSENDISSINKQRVQDWIESAIPDIESLILALPTEHLSDNDAADATINLLLKKIHFSQTDTHALRQLLLRHRALYGELPPQETLQALGTSNKVKHYLQAALSRASVAYP